MASTNATEKQDSASAATGKYPADSILSLAPYTRMSIRLFPI